MRRVGEQISRDPCEPLASAPLASILTPLPPTLSSIPPSVHLCTPGPSGSSPYLSHSSWLLYPQMDCPSLSPLSESSPGCHPSLLARPSFLCTLCGLTQLSFLPSCLLLPALPHPLSASPVESMASSSTVCPTASVVPIGARGGPHALVWPKGADFAPISGPIPITVPTSPRF